MEEPKITFSLGGGIHANFFTDKRDKPLNIEYFLPGSNFSFNYDTFSIEYHKIYEYVYDRRGELLMMGIPKPSVRIHREGEN